MTQEILIAVVVLGAIGALFAVVLYIVAQKFKVIEDPLIDEVAEKIKRLPTPRGKSVRPVLVYDGHLAPIIETEGFFDALISFRSLLGI